MGTSGDAPSPAAAGGLGGGGVCSSGPMQPHHCLSGCKTRTRGQEGHGGDRKDMEGTAASGSIHRRGGNSRREDVSHPEPPVQQECPKAEGDTLLPQVPQTSCHSPIPSRCHRRAGAAALGNQERLKYPTEQQSPSLTAD